MEFTPALLEGTNLLTFTKMVEDKYINIPFGNSQFQNEQFVINASLTPQRAFRQVALELNSRLGALRQGYFGARRHEVKKAQLKDKITNTVDLYEKQLLEIDLEELVAGESTTKKMVMDTLEEVKVFYSYFEKLPQFSREEFEAGEREYFETRLKKQVVGIVGALESLDNMGVDVGATNNPKVLPMIEQLQKLIEAKS